LDGLCLEIGNQPITKMPVPESSRLRFTLRDLLLFMSICAVVFAVLRLLPLAVIQAGVLCLPTIALVGVWAIFRQKPFLFRVGLFGGFVGLVGTPHVSGPWQLGQDWSGLLSPNGLLTIIGTCFGAGVMLIMTEIIGFVRRRRRTARVARAVRKIRENPMTHWWDKGQSP